MISPSRFDEATVRARYRLLTVGAVASLVLGVVVSVVVSIVVGVVAFVVLSGAWAVLAQTTLAGAPSRVVAGIGGRVTPEDDLPGVHEALYSVAMQTGVAMPEVRVIDHGAANACVVADAESATVVVTTALIEDIRWVELEAVAAELLCRVRDGSARFVTLAAGMPGWLAALAGLSPTSVAGVLGDQRSTRADLDVVDVTRYPPALIGALESMADRGTSVDVAEARTAALWVAPAVGVDAGVDLAIDRTANQPLDYRIAALREL